MYSTLYIGEPAACYTITVRFHRSRAIRFDFSERVRAIVLYTYLLNCTGTSEETLLLLPYLLTRYRV